MTVGSASAMPVKDRLAAATNSDATIQRGSIMRGESNHANQQKGVRYHELSFVLGYLVFWLLAPGFCCPMLAN